MSSNNNDDVSLTQQSRLAPSSGSEINVENSNTPPNKKVKTDLVLPPNESSSSSGSEEAIVQYGSVRCTSKTSTDARDNATSRKGLTIMLLAGNSSKDESSDSDADENALDKQEIEKQGQKQQQNVAESQLEALNKMIICPLCNGYFRHPYRLIECLHTFCRICLFKNLKEKKRDYWTNFACPTCNADIGVDPLKLGMALPDRSMEEIVNTLFPHLQLEDLATWYRYKHKFDLENGNSTDTSPIAEIEAMGELALEFRLEPLNQSGQPQLSRPEICVSGLIKVKELKNYLLKQLQQHEQNTTVAVATTLSSIDQLDVFCNSQLLGNEMSLLCVHELVWKGKGGAKNETDHMLLHYGIK